MGILLNSLLCVPGGLSAIRTLICSGKFGFAFKVTCGLQVFL